MQKSFRIDATARGSKGKLSKIETNITQPLKVHVTYNCKRGIRPDACLKEVTTFTQKIYKFQGSRSPICKTQILIAIEMPDFRFKCEKGYISQLYKLLVAAG